MVLREISPEQEAEIARQRASNSFISISASGSLIKEEISMFLSSLFGNTKAIFSNAESSGVASQASYFLPVPLTFYTIV